MVIDVLDDGLFLDASKATVTDSTVKGMDFSFYLTHGSTAMAASDTFGVRLMLPNPKQDLPAGVNCTAKFPNSDQ